MVEFQFEFLTFFFFLWIPFYLCTFTKIIILTQQIVFSILKQLQWQLLIQATFIRTLKTCLLQSNGILKFLNFENQHKQSPIGDQTTFCTISKRLFGEGEIFSTSWSQYPIKNLILPVFCFFRWFISLSICLKRISYPSSVLQLCSLLSFS